MESLAFALPVLPGRNGAAKAFLAELEGPWRARYEESQRRIGMTRESWFLQEGPEQALLVVHLESADVGAALAAFTTSGGDFERWFTEGLAEVTGFRMDPDAGPPSVLLSHYTATP